ncbi:MAG: DUF1343 domain-containing protein [Bacteroidales bacterium]|jgi:uncharacterized protein YbbC (DUF1343 family)|nr:DUF1343 domain-containing protein [Bacteroidales bacterium]
MRKLLFFLILIFLVLSLFSQNDGIKTGAERTELYFPLLGGKNIVLVVNQTSVIGERHLVDTLLTAGFQIDKIFAPEHGFRGDADAGAVVKNAKDKKTGLPIVSIYGKNKKPTPEQLKGIDLVVFDIQDVGVRFYTYISTMHYVMEACAENNVEMMILDRPNPHGATVNGPVLELAYQSFVGMHPIPVLHGLTVGELAQMINGEKWLEGGLFCRLHVIPCSGWDHSMPWQIHIPPSPNLPNMQAILLYPSLCFFEGTEVSVGRGTEFPFQVIGYPDPKFGAFTFTPKSGYGAENPLQKDKKCCGIDLRDIDPEPFTLRYFLTFRDKFDAPDQLITRASFFNLLAGNAILAQQIQQGLSEKEITISWENDLKNYKLLRKKYLLYKDFE